MQVYAGQTNSELCGLDIANDDPVSPLIVTTEQLSGKWRALFVRRNSDAKLHVVQSVVIDETLLSDWVTFARWPEGNLFCAIYGSDCLHELSRAPSTSRTPFEDTSRKHPLSNKVRDICGLLSNGVCRLAASFYDYSIRVFRVVAAGGALDELQRITPPQPQNTWEPYLLVALPGGSLVVRSYFTDPADSKTKYGIECCAAKSDGTLSSPKRLFSQELAFDLWGLLPPTETFPTYRFTAFNRNCELLLLSIKAQ